MFKPMRWRTPEWIHFGFDTARQVGPEAKRLGADRVLVFSGPNVAKSGLMEPIFASIRELNLEYDHFDQVAEEPPIANFNEALQAAKKGNFDVCVGVGGGSAMDLAKMVAAMMGNDGKLEDYFGVDLVPRRGRPSIAVSTTAGTGSEVTRISVFSDPEAKTKRVVSAWNILADVAIVDPRLTVSMPPRVTADTGMDAFIHALESYLANGANPLTEELSLKSMRLVARHLGPAFANGGNLEARYHMSLASLLAGMTLNNAGVGIMHAFSFPIGFEHGLAHGPALTAVMPATLRKIFVACPEKFRKIAAAFDLDTTGLDAFEAAEASVEVITALTEQLGLPTRLRDVGVDRSRFDAWAQAVHANKRLLDNTPRLLSLEDIRGILDAAY